MAYLIIQGINHNLTKREAERAIDFFGKHLLGRMYKHLDIEVDFIRLRGMWGRCGVISLHRDKCRDFGIQVNSKLCKKNQIKTLAHEMVHIKQFARGEFMELDRDKYKWKSRVLHLPESEYMRFPWEVEAYNMENKLYELYKDQI